MNRFLGKIIPSFFVGVGVAVIAGSTILAILIGVLVFAVSLMLPDDPHA